MKRTWRIDSLIARFHFHFSSQEIIIYFRGTLHSKMGLNWDELYKDFLFRSEDEYCLFGLLVPKEFWNKDNNIKEFYLSLFQSKIERSIEKTFISHVNSKYNSEEVLTIISKDLGTKNWENSLGLLNKLEDLFRTEINRSLESIYEYTSDELLDISRFPIDELASRLMYRFDSYLEDFTTRLEIIKNNEDIFEYYTKVEHMENMESKNFPSKDSLLKLDFDFTSISQLGYWLI